MKHAAPRTGARAALLLGAYLLVCVAPLALSFTSLMPSRGFWINFSIALGFVGLSVLGMQFALTSRLARLTQPFGIDAILRYHRQITLLAVVAVFGHPLILFLVSSKYRALLNVLHAPVRAQLAWAAVVALTLLVITSVWRKTLRLSYGVWHVLHALLGMVCVLAALGHAMLVHYYTSERWVEAAWIAYGAAFLWLSLWVRLVRPLRRGFQPWRVTSLWPEPGGAFTVGVEPAVTGRRDFQFRPGQFAWVHSNPLAFDYHPFSISSSALAPRLEFTIAAVGPDTDRMRHIRIGDPLYIDGPHGSFTLDRSSRYGLVFLATGVGITPILSMLATLADQGDQRPIWLFLGNRFETQITGIRQLANLNARMPQLTMVNVISRPSEDWSGERGHISAALLWDYLPRTSYRALDFYLCGRDDIVRELSAMLCTRLNVSRSRIHAEDFALA